MLPFLCETGHRGKFFQRLSTNFSYTYLPILKINVIDLLFYTSDSPHHYLNCLQSNTQKTLYYKTTQEKYLKEIKDNFRGCLLVSWSTLLWKNENLKVPSSHPSFWLNCTFHSPKITADILLSLRQIYGGGNYSDKIKLCIQLWGPCHSNDIKLLEPAQTRPPKWSEHLYGEEGGENWDCSIWKREGFGVTKFWPSSTWRSWKKNVERIFTRVVGQEGMVSDWKRVGLNWILRKKIYCEGGEAWN